MQSRLRTGLKSTSKSNHCITQQKCIKRLADAVKEKSPLQKPQTGPLPVYKIPLEEVQIDVTGCRRFSFGKNSTKSNRTIMVLGPCGAGKSTLINGMINYILDVEWEDSYRFKLVDEDQSKSKAHGQTNEVTVYKINHEKGFKIEYSLTIVDTPGFGDTRGIERDKEITEQLRDLFSAELGVSEIDAVCFVAQATSAQLTPSQKYEIDSVLSIFDKDVAENIRVLVTFADGQRPPVLEAINAAGVPCPKTKDGLPVHFKFNNSALFADNKSAADSMSEDEEDGGFDQMFWNIGTKSLKRFFNALNVTETKSVTMKKKVLKERVRFESSILSNEVVISGTRNYLNTCQQCKFICHSSCRIPNDKIQCWAIGSNGRCTQCPGKCYWDKHFCQKYIWESEEEHIVKKLKNND